MQREITSHVSTGPVRLFSRRKILAGIVALPMFLSLPRSVRAAEPFTMAWVGIKLTEGAIAFVGGELLRIALGEPSISDVKKWIEHAVRELKEFVAEQLRRQTLAQIDADLSGVIYNVHHYAALTDENQQKNVYLLEHAVNTTSSLVPQSLRFEEAYFVTTVALAYRLFAVYGLYRLDGDKGHIRSLQLMVDDVLRTLSVRRDDLGFRMAPERRYGMSCFSRSSGTGVPHKQPNGAGTMVYSCVGTDKGKAITSRHSVAIGIEDVYHAIYGVVRDRVRTELAQHTEPMRQRADKFLRAADTSIQRILECYQAMSSQVGQSYSLPQDAPAILGYDPVAPLNLPKGE